jgi:hypothetical protein
VCDIFRHTFSDLMVGDHFAVAAVNRGGEVTALRGRREAKPMHAKRPHLPKEGKYGAPSS